VGVPAANGGSPCVAANNARETRTCYSSVPCTFPQSCVGNWSEWGACTQTCGSGGTQSRSYTVSVAAANGGSPCVAANNARETRTCYSSVPCTLPQSCVGIWSEWGACTQTCGSGGTQSRSYTVSVAATNGGSACAVNHGTMDSRACDPAPPTCVIDCVGSWSAYGACSVTCGDGIQSRAYSVTRTAANGGAACPVTDGETQSRTCDQPICPLPVNTISAKITLNLEITTLAPGARDMQPFSKFELASDLVG
jgi:hypothetical protein